jgi:hypothetical protein
MATQTRRVTLPSGDSLPLLGQGSWHPGEDDNAFAPRARPQLEAR